ncbi:hypothetical protein AB0B54_33505 [Microbispora bryophytorum]|uniref:hypothetical protein n=1 Tax=Microbispora bryophytorum TaxID=1460882 RepID=UPI0033CF9B38
MGADQASRRRRHARRPSLDELERWWRTVELDRGVPRVTIEDCWHFAADEGESVPSALHFLLAGRVERHAAASLTVRARAGSRPVLVTWRPQALTAVLTPRALEDPMLSAVWGENLTRLALVVPSTRQGVIDIRMEVDE